jgi:hypothetical protein
MEIKGIVKDLSKLNLERHKYELHQVQDPNSNAIAQMQKYKSDQRLHDTKFIG